MFGKRSSRDSRPPVSFDNRTRSRSARNSLSALDDKRAELMRSGFFAYFKTENPALAPKPAPDHNGGPKGNRRSMPVVPTYPSTPGITSRPPLSRPFLLHQRHSSASASLPTPPVGSFAYRPSSYHDYHDGVRAVDLLKPPPSFGGRQPASLHTSLPPVPAPASAVPGRAMSAAPAVLPPSPISSWEKATASAPPAFPLTRDDETRDCFASRSDMDAAVTAAIPRERIPARHSAPYSPHSVPRSHMVGEAAHGSETYPPSSSRSGMPGRPRRISNGSTFSSGTTATGSTMASRDSFQSFDSQARARSASWGSQTSFESAVSSFNPGGAGVPPAHSVTAPAGHAWQRPAPLKTYRSRAQPNELFAQLPGEVLELILEELRKLHLDKGSTSCATCWMRDACAVGLSCRTWLKFARAALYGDIQLVGADAAPQRKRYKLAYGSRLVLLRRSLRASPALAAIPRSLKVPGVPAAGVAPEEYYDLVATVVMACPNLERLAGPHPGYNHAFGRVFHALATRQRLRDMTWVLDAPPVERQHRAQGGSGDQADMMARNMLAPGDLLPQQSDAFLELHANWRHLSSLTIHCVPGATLSPGLLLPAVLSRLPSLQTLYLSRLPVTSFDDDTLPYLPPLKKLSIAHCAGVSSAGLSAFATHASAQSLETLTLVHANLDSLPALARILSHLGSLATFSLVQDVPPAMPDDLFLWLMMPYLASGSLRKLHWDIVDDYPADTAAAALPAAADTILARSIAAGGFPALRVLRAPNDPDGLFQSLCKPRERADLPGDRYRGRTGPPPGARPHTSAGPGHARSGSVLSAGQASTFGPGNSPAGTPTTGQFSIPGSDSGVAGLLPTLREATELHGARLAAQDRLESARRWPRFTVAVADERGETVEKYGVAGFAGDVGSRIAYHLLPDPGGTDEAGGLAGVEEFLADGGEELSPPGAGGGSKGKDGKGGKRGKDDGGPAKTREGCTGRWNAHSEQVLDKKDKQRWWHTERGRWREVTLS